MDNCRISRTQITGEVIFYNPKTGRYSLDKNTRKKISESVSGSKNRNWKGGITSKNKRIRNGFDIRLWRDKVFKRDNWTCQKSGKKGNILNVHHIQNFSDFPKLRTSITNGITLSKDEHIRFHKIYGQKNNTKEQIIKFLNS